VLSYPTAERQAAEHVLEPMGCKGIRARHQDQGGIAARAGLAYSDAGGRVYVDQTSAPLADGGFVRTPRGEELIPAPPGTVAVMLPGRVPLVDLGEWKAERRTALAALLPAGYTRLLLPAYRERSAAPTLPLFGYTFACAVDETLYVGAMKTDEGEDWTPRYFGAGELEREPRPPRVDRQGG